MIEGTIGNFRCNTVIMGVLLLHRRFPVWNVSRKCSKFHNTPISFSGGLKSSNFIVFVWVLVLLFDSLVCYLGLWFDIRLFCCSVLWFIIRFFGSFYINKDLSYLIFVFRLLCYSVLWFIIQFIGFFGLFPVWFGSIYLVFWLFVCFVRFFGFVFVFGLLLVHLIFNNFFIWFFGLLFGSMVGDFSEEKKTSMASLSLHEQLNSFTSLPGDVVSWVVYIDVSRVMVWRAGGCFVRYPCFSGRIMGKRLSVLLLPLLHFAEVASLVVSTEDGHLKRLCWFG